ncbi:hypothetical protein IVB46_34080 [Bradyrhizobium sp. 61]|uniref:hypothetical protein n=1 Tax=Bradyrhizobium TaxID=374 RepID=UPI001FF71654|nr:MULTISPECIES: hypothetical protein [Bradyrhizobium]MCK1280262.1 hypothetical protein [Bradyrhizobium sp. 61]MCK1444052.1 hypothetical protein [Bradyrhizobium sp. 48]MCK1462655.1 hypothetical protein [Bradyrhizobium sp. 2]MCS3932158.1 hypothetical protein [Bradyrhizobium elkanii]MCS3972716.1 hypothetical protein [Bradyrhizobium japonicum]
MKTLAMSALILATLSIAPVSAAPIGPAAHLNPNQRPGCSLSGGAVANCKNVLNFKSYYECRSNRMERGWTGVESGYYCRALDLK